MEWAGRLTYLLVYAATKASSEHPRRYQSAGLNSKKGACPSSEFNMKSNNDYEILYGN